MVNHPNRKRKPISHRDMVENHMDFYPVTLSFEPKALRLQALIHSCRLVDLWICVEWDSKRVLMGYHWQPAIGGSRDRAGLESWFQLWGVVTEALGLREERECTYADPVDVCQQNHDFILKLARTCQEILDSGPVDESIKQAVRERLTVSATTQTRAS